MSAQPRVHGLPLDGVEFAGEIGWRSDRDPGALAHARDARLGELQTGAGAPPLLVEDRGNLVVGVVAGEAADELDRGLGGPSGFAAAAGERHRELGAGAAFPADLDARTARIRVHGDDDLDDQRSQQFLALAWCGRRRVPQPRQLARVPGERFSLRARQWLWLALFEFGQRPALVLERHQCLLQARLQRARDEPVFRLAGVVLALTALGLEHRALNGEEPAGDPLGVAVLDLGDRRGACADASGGNGLQERLRSPPDRAALRRVTGTSLR